MPFLQALPVSDLVRHLRQHLNLLQGKLAAGLGVSFNVANRWEQRHTVPSPMAIKLIENLLQSTGDLKEAHLKQSCPLRELDV